MRINSTFDGNLALRSGSAKVKIRRDLKADGLSAIMNGIVALSPREAQCVTACLCSMFVSKIPNGKLYSD